MADRAGDRQGEATSIVGLGLSALAQGAHDEARAHFRRAAAIYRQLRDIDAERSVLAQLKRLDQAAAPLEAAPPGTPAMSNAEPHDEGDSPAGESLG